MRTIYYILLFIFPFSLAALAADPVKGYVFDETNDPIIGANVYWEGTQTGTTTNTEGYFEIEPVDETSQLVISYIGYTPKTFTATPAERPLHITMSGEIELQEFVVTERKMGTISSRTAVLQTQKITFDELCRAACCNLAESFETNPSVDVSYS
ncbi:MAG: carboxypeptidase-like regulatory domain-containing protein, partial [Tannerellaceae bacterium]|nr:carboxypeptidase-like regulatory domain-containing protein [Tannerellaceae bacterium]